ncbi:hypothetical protein SEA_FUSHIGI_36 [Mycobacterium phage Fushigi]|nr:hypothetical protein SEA_FUSHIGI_36 [Mycobacterium phage Fushigi]
MSLKVGGLDVVGVFVGDAAAKVYVGAMKIWPPVPDFTPFTISSEDPGYEDLIDEPVPEGASGCWVTLVGGGGGGGAGYQSFDDTYRRGGGGGAGGAKIPRVWVPREAMGSSYSVVLGLGGAYTGGGSTGFGGTDGGSSSFLSGSVSLIAGGVARDRAAVRGLVARAGHRGKEHLAPVDERSADVRRPRRADSHDRLRGSAGVRAASQARQRGRTATHRDVVERLPENAEKPPTRRVRARRGLSGSLYSVVGLRPSAWTLEGFTGPRGPARTAAEACHGRRGSALSRRSRSP